MATTSIIRGSVSTTDRVSNAHPESWREQLHKLVYAGHVPFTATLDAIARGTTGSVKHHWWQQAAWKGFGDVTDVYTDALLASAYSSGGAAGDTLYLKAAEADAKQLVAGNVISVVDDDQTSLQARVTDVRLDGASSSIAIKLLQADSSDDLAGTSLYFHVSGDAREDGSQLPTALFEDATEYENYCQTFMASVELTGTELAEEERMSPGKYQRAVKDGLQRLMESMEQAFLWGDKSTTTGANGKPLRYMDGVITMISDNASSNIINFKTSTAADYSGKTWLAAGQDLLDNVMLAVTEYATPGNTYKCYCGDLAWKAVIDLARDQGHQEIETSQDDFGIVVQKIKGLFQDVEFYVHPAFRKFSPYRRSALFLKPELCRILDMKGRGLTYIKANRTNKSGGFWQPENGTDWVDGIKEGWARQCTLEADQVESMALVHNLGADNTN